MFVDTNVLVFARVVESPDHEIAVDRLGRAFQTSEPPRISRQILREYLSVVTRPLSWRAALPLSEALDDVDKLLDTYSLLEDGPAVMQIAGTAIEKAFKARLQILQVGVMGTIWSSCTSLPNARQAMS